MLGVAKVWRSWAKSQTPNFKGLSIAISADDILKSCYNMFWILKPSLHRVKTDLFQHWIDNHLFVLVSFTHSAKTYWATWAGCWATSWALGCGRASSPRSHEALILVRGADHTSVNRYLCLIMPGGEKYCEEKEVKRWKGESGSTILDG